MPHAQMAVTDRAIHEIKAMISSGQLQPGQKLPPEKPLAERIGVSRNSLREAVRALSLIRVLDVRQGDGTYVTSLAPELMGASIGFTLDLHPGTAVGDIMAVRRLLEPEAVRLAASRLQEGDLAELAGLMEGLDENTDIEELVTADIAFHHLINSRCGNPYLASMLDGLASSTARARLWRGLHEQASVQRTLAEHQQILDALSAGQAELAGVYAAAHIAGVESWLRRSPLDAVDPRISGSTPES